MDEIKGQSESSCGKQVKDLALSLQQLRYCCGVDLILGLRISLSFLFLSFFPFSLPLFLSPNLRHR